MVGILMTAPPPSGYSYLSRTIYTGNATFTPNAATRLLRVITIGGGGGGGSAGDSGAGGGGTGGNSSFGAFHTANGGGAGGGATNTVANTLVFGTGGGGGTATGGDINISGEGGFCGNINAAGTLTGNRFQCGKGGGNAIYQKDLVTQTNAAANAGGTPVNRGVGGDGAAWTTAANANALARAGGGGGVAIEDIFITAGSLSGGVTVTVGTNGSGGTASGGLNGQQGSGGQVIIEEWV